MVSAATFSPLSRVETVFDSFMKLVVVAVVVVRENFHSSVYFLKSCRQFAVWEHLLDAGGGLDSAVSYDM